MAGRYKPYPDYKSSGIEWVEYIPEHWNTSYLGFECSVKARLGWKGLKAEEYVDDGYVFLATPNIKDKEIDFVNVDRITSERYGESPEIMLEVGDILVTKDGSTTGTTNAVRFLPEPATVNSSIAVLRSRGGVKSSFLFYFFTSDYTQNIINRMRGGMGVPHLFQADLRKFNILMPPEQEQVQIAKFLDHETAKIDTLIDKQQRLIQLLKEKRQAVISHAVTKGLSSLNGGPSAKMRDSGVEWLGDVPEHWEVVQLKRYSIVRGGYAFNSDSFIDDGEPVIRISDINVDGTVLLDNCKGVSDEIASKYRDFSVSPGELVMAMTGATIGKAGWFKEDRPALINQRVGVFKCNGVFLTYRFLWFILNSRGYQEYIQLTAFGGAQPNISDSGMVAYRVAIPPIEDQDVIANYIDNIASAIDSLVFKANLAIGLIQERRTALISAAVTGKIDVRDWVAPPASPTNQEVAS